MWRTSHVPRPDPPIPPPRGNERGPGAIRRSGVDRATRTHLACRIPASGKGDHDALTIVLDARTGQVTGQHASHSTWALQLTGSALLDGATAYDLNTGEVRWPLPNPGSLTGGDIKRRDVHSGAAGHSSFVLMSTPSGDNTGLRATATVVLISDSEPDTTTKVSDIAVDPFTDRLAIIDGWTVQYTGSSDAMAQAVTLNSLPGQPNPASQSGEALTLLQVPGATVVVFNSAYGSSSGHGQRGPEAGHAYRIHGLPEGAS